MPAPVNDPAPPPPVHPADVLADAAAARDRAASTGAAPSPDLQTAIDRAAALARGRYENFTVLSGLVPPGLRDGFAAVYAYCRFADDLADETGVGPEARDTSLQLLRWWREELRACFEGRPRHAVFVALQPAIERHGLRPEPFHRLLDAFEADQTTTRYRTWDEVIGYCRGSADPVGHLVLQLAGVRPPDEAPGNADLYAMSDSICTALQLTNHWQDVRRDLLDRDRVYLPAQETGLDAPTLRDFAQRGHDPAARVPFIRALRPLVERTKALFDAGRPLPRALGRDDASGLPGIGPVVALLAAGGERVLHKIDAAGCTTLWHRPTLGRLDRAGVFAAVWLASRFWPRTPTRGRPGG